MSTPLERAEQPAPADQAAILREAADFLRDAHLRDGLSVQEIGAALRHMASEATVTPPPALTEEGRLRAQVEVLTQDAERDRGLAKVGARCMREGHQGRIEHGLAVIEGWRFALSTTLDLGTGAPWDAIHERVQELRRMADGAQQPEAQAWPPETSWQIETQWHNGDWRSWALRTEHDDAVREFAAVEDDTHAWRLVRFDTTTTVEAEHAVPQLGKEA